uniref:Gamma-glutamylcyclotransferase family protein n=2 Tax=Octopus bimaculoides TaxID=37653 RepID=A0A0L8GR56_OCTBM
MTVQLERVFVYGTLKRGQPNHFLIENVTNGLAKFIGDATTALRYPLVIASQYNIPFLLPFEGKGNFISGEVYDVDGKMLTRLDELEQHPDVYKREKISVISNGNSFMSWCYILQKPKPKLLDLEFLDNYNNNNSAEKDKYIRRTKDDTPFLPQVMES